MRRFQLPPIRLSISRPRRISWLHVLIAVSVVATGVAAGSSYLQATGSLTVNTIWQHTPIAFKQVCSACTPGLTSGPLMSYDPNDGLVILVKNTGGTTIYDYSGGTDFTSFTPTVGSNGAIPAWTSSTLSAMGTDWGTNYESTVGYGASPVVFDGSGTNYECSIALSVVPSSFVEEPCLPGAAWGSGGSLEGAYEQLYELASPPESCNKVASSTYCYVQELFISSSGTFWVMDFGLAPTSLSCGTCTAVGAQAGAALVWDAADGYDLLFDTSGNTWKIYWNSAAAAVQWTKLTSAGPGPRAGASIAYDIACGYVVLYGGLAAGVNKNDMWKWTGGSTNAWTEIDGSILGADGKLLASSSEPSARNSAAMDYDAAVGQLVIYGGTTATTFDSTSNDLGDAYSLSLATAGGGCP